MKLILNTLMSSSLAFSSLAISAPSPYLVTDDMFPVRNEAKEQLGKFLMYDKILSGNKNISCASCHHPLAGLGDGLSLPVGEGGQGLGITRNTGTDADAIKERVPRNAPHVFNLGATEFVNMFHDGRVSIDAESESGFASPAKEQLPKGLDNVLAVQAMFPVTSGAEMAGQSGENSIADAAELNNLGNEAGVWELIADRLKEIPEYVSLFQAAYDDIDSAADISYVHAANAIAAFEASAWRCTNSPFDRYFQKDNQSLEPLNAISDDALKGAQIFQDKAGCFECHNGPFLTDHQFYSTGVPQIGPGKGDNQSGYSDGHDDFGREAVTGDINDRFKFRTPTLRQVAQTGPWGHDGAFNTLEAMVRHHLDAVNSLNNYDTSQAVLPSREDLDSQDFIVQNDPARRQAIADSIETSKVSLTDEEIQQLLIFLDSLTDTQCIDLRATVPTRVPSGLPMYE